MRYITFPKYVNKLCLLIQNFQSEVYPNVDTDCYHEQNPKFSMLLHLFWMHKLNIAQYKNVFLLSLREQPKRRFTLRTMHTTFT